MMDRKTYTLKEIETDLKVSRRTLYRWIKEGKLEAYKVGGNWRVAEESLSKMKKAYI